MRTYLLLSSSEVNSIDYEDAMSIDERYIVSDKFVTIYICML